jgi:hypothetical protein
MHRLSFFYFAPAYPHDLSFPKLLRLSFFGSFFRRLSPSHDAPTSRMPFPFLVFLIHPLGVRGCKTAVALLCQVVSPRCRAWWLPITKVIPLFVSLTINCVSRFRGSKCGFSVMHDTYSLQDSLDVIRYVGGACSMTFFRTKTEPQTLPWTE